MEETYQVTGALKHTPYGKHVALLTDARFSGVSTGACIGHVSPEAASGGVIGLVQDGDFIDIDIPNRKISLRVSDEVLAVRRAAQDAAGWKPVKQRPRKVSQALKAYGMFASSADRGAVRILPDEV